MDIKSVARRIDELVRGGMSPVEAAETALRESVVPATHNERIKYIQGLEDIALLRDLNKRAHAKLSSEKRGKNKPEAIARYTAEVEATKERLKFLAAKAESSEAGLEELIKLGATTSTVIQAWLTKKEGLIAPQLKELKRRKGWTNPQLKAAVGVASSQLPEVFVTELKKLGDEYLDNVTQRLERGDQRVIAVVRKWNLLSN